MTTTRLNNRDPKAPAWVLDDVIHFMGGTPEDHANVARANRKARRAGTLRRVRRMLRFGR